MRRDSSIRHGRRQAAVERAAGQHLQTRDSPHGAPPSSEHRHRAWSHQGGRPAARS
eukprot:PRCOL_00006706-RA